MLRKSGPVEDNELNRSEGKITSRNGLSSFSAPSSLTTLNAQATPKKKLLAESPGPEVREYMCWGFFRVWVFFTIYIGNF